MNGRGALTVVAAAASLSGCALTSRTEPSPWQYYTPERVEPAREATSVRGTTRNVCIGRVTAGTGLGRAIAYGDGAYEAGYYEDRRWTEEPERYVDGQLDRCHVRAPAQVRRDVPGVDQLDRAGAQVEASDQSGHEVLEAVAVGVRGQRLVS